MRQGANYRRSRGRNNNRKSQSPARVHTYDSNGPDVRIRGNAYQVFEKYLSLARDATAGGDRIGAENYYQHAEHYFRLMNADGQQNGNGSGRGRGRANGNGRDQEDGENASYDDQESAENEPVAADAD